MGSRLKIRRDPQGYSDGEKGEAMTERIRERAEIAANSFVAECGHWDGNPMSTAFGPTRLSQMIESAIRAEIEPLIACLHPFAYLGSRMVGDANYGDGCPLSPRPEFEPFSHPTVGDARVALALFIKYTGSKPTEPEK